VVVLVHPRCCDVHGHDSVCANAERDGWEDRVRIFVRRIEPVRDSPGDSLCAALAMGGQPERKCVRDIPCALRVCCLDTVRGTALVDAGIREGPGSIACSSGYELGDGSAHEAE
jgi:hypothetical protein